MPPGAPIDTCLLFAACLAGWVPNDTVCTLLSLEHSLCSNKILFIRTPVDKNSSIRQIQMELLTELAAG